MDREETIRQYLMEKYHPSVLIAYGSFADGTAGTGSDYDAMLVYDGPECHDGSVVGGTALDVFCYPEDRFADSFNPEDYLGVYDGIILEDSRGLGQKIRNQVRDFIQSTPQKTEAQLRHEIEWCKKMLVRSHRGDAEGYFRWHWVLVDSLEFYFDIVGRFYFGPKKSLRYLKENDSRAFACYEAAVREFSADSLRAWIEYLDSLFQERFPRA